MSSSDGAPLQGRRHRKRSGIRAVGLTMAFALALVGCVPGSGPPGSVNGPVDGDALDLSEVEQGWGPARPFFTMGDRPADAVFNSITDNPDIQDERTFLQLHRVGAPGGTRTGDFALEPATTYEGYINFYNDASGPGQVSRDTRVLAQLPATVSSREHVSAIVSSGTAEITNVWRTLVLTAPMNRTVALRVVPDSVKMFTGRAPSGISLSAHDLFSQRGALVGCDKPDGVVTGSEDCQGYVRFRFVTDQPNFSVSQRLAVSGSDQWGHSSEFTPGQAIDHKIKYENTGTTQQDDVIIKNTLPAGATYVDGSTQISNSTTGNRWTPVSGDAVTGRGINLGSYAPGGAVYVKFTVRMPTGERLGCGTHKLTNAVAAETANGTKSTEATIWLKKSC